jgi:hypothetical protein
MHDLAKFISNWNKTNGSDVYQNVRRVFNYADMWSQQSGDERNVYITSEHDFPIIRFHAEIVPPQHNVINPGINKLSSVNAWGAFESISIIEQLLFQPHLRIACFTECSCNARLMANQAPLPGASMGAHAVITASISHRVFSAVCMNTLIMGAALLCWFHTKGDHIWRWVSKAGN